MGFAKTTLLFDFLGRGLYFGLVDGILERLQIERWINYSSLHRPDALMEPGEVARLPDHLEQEARQVRHFKGCQSKS